MTSRSMIFFLSQWQIVYYSPRLEPRAFWSFFAVKCNGCSKVTWNHKKKTINYWNILNCFLFLGLYFWHCQHVIWWKSFFRKYLIYIKISIGTFNGLVRCFFFKWIIWIWTWTMNIWMNVIHVVPNIFFFTFPDSEFMN